MLDITANDNIGSLDWAKGNLFKKQMIGQNRCWRRGGGRYAKGTRQKKQHPQNPATSGGWLSRTEVPLGTKPLTGSFIQ